MRIYIQNWNTTFAENGQLAPSPSKYFIFEL